MIDDVSWTNKFTAALDEIFGERVFFVGLQGSYARGEATDKSDIDMVVVLDKLTAADVRCYDRMLDTLPHRDRACGFLCGKNEIMNWDAADLFSLYYDTNPINGTIESLLPLLDDSAAMRAIKIGVCNIFHGCVHNMLYDKSEKVLKALYKSALFALRTIIFCREGRNVRRREELFEVALPDERAILEVFVSYNEGNSVDFDYASELLFEWSKAWIEKTK